MTRQANYSERKTRIYRRRELAPPPPDLHVPVPGRRVAAPATRSRRRWPLFLLAALCLFLVAAGSVGAGAYLYQRNRIMPGVHTLGVSLGGQQVEAATAALAQNWERRRIRVETGSDAPPTLAPDALGIVLDAEATARAAYQQGRHLASIEAAVRNALSPAGFEPSWTFNPVVARSALTELSAEISVPPVDAGIQFVNGHVESTPAQPGRELDVEATLSWLRQNAGLVVFSERLPLVTHVVQPAVSDSSPVAAALNEQLGRGISLRAYDPVRNETHEAVIPPEAWTGWLNLRPDASAPGGVAWEVDQAQIEPYVEAQATAFGADRYLDTPVAAAALASTIRSREEAVARVRIYHHPGSYTVQPGDTLSSIATAVGIPYPWLQQANPNSADGLRPGQTITIPSPDLLLPLPVVEEKRIVVSISQQRMWAYEQGEVRWEWPVSTGIDSSPTAPGVFQIQSHEPNAYAGNWDLWMPNFMGIYRPVPTSDFMNGFHGFPTRNGSNLLWTSSLGHPVTYGCILISNDNAPLLYEWAEEGVVVEVSR